MHKNQAKQVWLLTYLSYSNLCTGLIDNGGDIIPGCGE